MAVRNIRRQATNPLGASGTPNTAPIYVDSDDNILKMIPAGSGTTEVQIVDVSSTQSLTNKTITGSQVYTSGNLAVVGSITSSDATTPILATATGKTNTGYLSLTGKTSGSLKILPADALAQVVTLDIAAQTVGATTLTIPDQANVSSSFVFTTLAQTLTNKTLTAPAIGAATGTSLAATSFIKSSGAAASGGVGYATGAGGAVTQITSRSTGVTVVPNPSLCGTITTHTASLAAEVAVDMIVTNSAVAIGDVVVVSIQSGATNAMTDVSVSTVTAGTFTIRTTNNSAAAGAAETGAILINYAIIKAVSA